MFTAQTNIALPDIPHTLRPLIKMIALKGKPTLRKQTGPGIFEVKNPTQILLNWCKNNISYNICDIADIGIQTIRQGNFEPHIDGPSSKGQLRHYNLMYMIDTGGQNVKTKIYNSPSELVAKVKQTDYSISYAEAELIETFEFQKHTWNLMNNQMFHSVEGITGTRIGLSISFFDAELPKFLQDLLTKSTTALSH
jgi:hypothetical protein